MVTARPTAPASPLPGLVRAANRRLTRLVPGTPTSAVAVAAFGLALTALVGVAAPNPNTAALAGPLSLLPGLPRWASYPVTYAAVLLAGLGTLGLLRAHAAGWRPDPGRLFRWSALAVAALCCLAPVGSSDLGSYVAYGHMAWLGLDPYLLAPGDVGVDYGAIVDHHWRHTPSVYGPLATWGQELAAWLAGGRIAVTGWVLMAANGAVFLLTSWLLLRYAPDPVRATLLWTANPLLVQVLVAGGHLDTAVAASGLAALLVARGRLGTGWRETLAGALVGIGCGFKANAALIGAGLAWDRLRSGVPDARGALARLAFGGLAVVAAAYATYGWHALAPLSEAAARVSGASPWRLVEPLAGPAWDEEVVRLGWPLLLLLLATRVRRVLPADADPAAATQFALAFAWVLAAPWVLPWYDALAWAFLALLPRTRCDRWLALHTTVLGLLHCSGWAPAPG